MPTFAGCPDASSLTSSPSPTRSAEPKGNGPLVAEQEALARGDVDLADRPLPDRDIADEVAAQEQEHGGGRRKWGDGTRVHREDSSGPKGFAGSSGLGFIAPVVGLVPGFGAASPSGFGAVGFAAGLADG